MKKVIASTVLIVLLALSLRADTYAPIISEVSAPSAPVTSAVGN